MLINWHNQMANERQQSIGQLRRAGPGRCSEEDLSSEASRRGWGGSRLWPQPLGSGTRPLLVSWGGPVRSGCRRARFLRETAVGSDRGSAWVTEIPGSGFPQGAGALSFGLLVRGHRASSLSETHSRSPGRSVLTVPWPEPLHTLLSLSPLRLPGSACSS